MSQTDPLRILAVDDHQMTLVGYKYILEEFECQGRKIRVDIASNYEQGKNKIEIASKSLAYDVLLFDLQLKLADSDNLHTGEDLGKLAKELLPGAKLVFLSTYSDNYRINSLLNNVDPDGYMVKSEIDQSNLRQMVESVSNNVPYYSRTALNAIRRRMANDLPLDENDKKILYHLSIGTKTKDLVNFVTLSLAGIENRKRQLKRIFEIEKQNDQALISEARRRGFI